MPIGVVATYTGSGSTASTPVTISAPTPGNLLVMVAIEIGSSAATWGSASINGSPGGGFTGRTPSGIRGFVADRVVASGDSTTVTLTQTGTTGFRYFLAELSGMNTSSPYDKSSGTTFASASSVATTLGAAVAQADEYVVSWAGHNGVNGGQVSASDGFTLYTTSTDTRRIGATKITSAVATPAPTLVWTTARAGQYIVAAWKMAAAGGATTNKTFTGGVTPAGELVKQANKTFAGGATPAGALTKGSVKLKTFIGGATPAGVLSRQTQKALIGSLTPGGAFVKLVAKPLAGAITPAGSLTKLKATLKTVAGSVTPAGVLSRQTQKPLAGSITPAGTLVKQTRKTFVGGATPSGALAKAFPKSFSGAITPAGLLSRQTRKTFNAEMWGVGIIGVVGAGVTGPGPATAPTPTGSEFNIVTYGAVLDGSTNDRAAWAAAIAAADAVDGTVLHPGGTSLIDGTKLIVPSNVTIAGIGPTSIIKCGSGLNSSFIFDTDGTTGVTIRDVKFDMNAQATAYAIAYRTTSNLLMDRIQFSNGPYYYVHEISSFLDGLTPLASNITARDCTFDTHTGGSRECIIAAYVNNFTLLRCRFTGTNLGFNIYRAAFNTVVQDCDFATITGANPNAILYGRGCDGITIDNCSLTAVGTTGSAAIRGAQPQDDYITNGGVGMPDFVQNVSITNSTFDGCGVAYQVGAVIGFTDRANLIENSLGTGVLVNSGNTSANFVGTKSHQLSWYGTKFLSNMTAGGTAALLFNSTQPGIDLETTVRRCTFDDVGATQTRAVAFQGTGVAGTSIFWGAIVDNSNAFIHPTTGVSLTNSATGEAVTNRAGVLYKLISKVAFTGGITPSATFTKLKATLKTLSGSITPAGALSKQTAKTLTGSITPAGTITKQTNKTFAGGITPAGSFAKLKVLLKTLSGSITPSGALVKQASKSLSGSITPAGALQKRTSKTLLGSVTPSGALVKLTAKTFLGSVTPTGALTKLKSLILTGSITPAGALSKRTSKTFAGTLTPAGVVVKQASKTFAGAITPTATFSKLKVLLKVLSGSITPAGTLSKQTRKTFTGSSTPGGSLVKSTSKTFAGNVTPAGTLTRLKATLKTFSGAITPTGVLTRRLNAQRTFSGTVSPTGSLVKQTAKTMSGAITPAGSFTKSRTAFKTFAGNITPAGALLRQLAKQFVGTIHPTVVFSKLKIPGAGPVLPVPDFELTGSDDTAVTLSSSLDEAVTLTGSIEGDPTLTGSEGTIDTLPGSDDSEVSL